MIHEIECRPDGTRKETFRSWTGMLLGVCAYALVSLVFIVTPSVGTDPVPEIPVVVVMSDDMSQLIAHLQEDPGCPQTMRVLEELGYVL